MGKSRKDHFSEVVDHIVERLRLMLEAGQIKPGGRIPSETTLMEMLGVKRGRVREAVQLLERFGVVHTSPQSGTYISTFGKMTLDSIMRNIQISHGGDYRSLIDTRAILERRAVELAAVRSRSQQVEEIERIQDAFEADVRKGGRALDENLSFHLKIAESSGSPYLISQLTILIPEVMALAMELDRHLGVQTERFERIGREHRCIIEAIKRKDATEAASLVESHIKHNLQTLDAIAREGSDGRPKHIESAPARFRLTARTEGLHGDYE